MTKFLNKWVRKAHRWLAVPTAIIILFAIFTRMTQGVYLQFPSQLEMVQAFLMLCLVITGTYLFLFPYLMKWRRGRRK